MELDGYNLDTGVLEWEQYPGQNSGTRTSYTYDNAGRLLSANGIVGNQNMSVNYSYTGPYLTGLQTPSTAYTFEYGDMHLRTRVLIEEAILASYQYTDQDHYLERLDYGNGDSVSYTYDDSGHMQSQQFEDGETYLYYYNNSGDLARIVEKGAGDSIGYTYDAYGRLSRYSVSTNWCRYQSLYAYQVDPDVISKTECEGSNIYGTTWYHYDDHDRIEKLERSRFRRFYNYDALGRLVSWEDQCDTQPRITSTIAYQPKSGDATKTTGLIASLALSGNGFAITYSYSYDDRGNIASISDGTHTTTYEYDNANQLIRENNEAAGFTWVWSYDGAGNIKSRQKYAYTTGSLTPTNALEHVSYGYGNNSWGDLLTSYDGRAITYDAIGNTLSDGIWSYTWEHGRQLASMKRGNTTWTYSYNASGLRERRSNGSTTYNYIYDGDQLAVLRIGGNTLRFTYDSAGNPWMVEYNGNSYYYILNAQGDVVGLANSNGERVVSYTYDAWGNIRSTTGSLASTLGQHNPLRYRGYVYDQETKLYYLQSRYYNPEIGRFINADGLVSTGHDILGNNMFAYCQNNPVNMTDSTGSWPEWIETTAKVVSAVVLVAAVATAVAAVSAFSAGTGTVGAVYGATVVLGAALSGINGAIANEANGNSYLNGYVGGATGCAIQGLASKTPIGTIIGGGGGVAVGTALTSLLNNMDPLSTNSSAENIMADSLSCGGKALITSSLTAFMGYSSDLAAIDGAMGLMPTYSFGFGEAVKTFFSWLDDAIVYIWE